MRRKRMFEHRNLVVCFSLSWMAAVSFAQAPAGPTAAGLSPDELVRILADPARVDDYHVALARLLEHPKTDLGQVLRDHIDLRRMILGGMFADLMGPHCWHGYVPTKETTAEYWRTYNRIAMALAPQASMETSVFLQLIQEPGDVRRLALGILQYLPPAHRHSGYDAAAEVLPTSVDFSAVRTMCYRQILASGDTSVIRGIFDGTQFDPSDLQDLMERYLETDDQLLLAEVTRAYARMREVRASPRLVESLIAAGERAKLGRTTPWAYQVLGSVCDDRAAEFLIERAFVLDTGAVTPACIFARHVDLVRRAYLGFPGEGFVDAHAVRMSGSAAALLLRRTGSEQLIVEDVATDDETRISARSVLFRSPAGRGRESPLTVGHGRSTATVMVSPIGN